MTEILNQFTSQKKLRNIKYFIKNWKYPQNITLRQEVIIT